MRRVVLVVVILIDLITGRFVVRAGVYVSL